MGNNSSLHEIHELERKKKFTILNCSVKIVQNQRGYIYTKYSAIDIGFKYNNNSYYITIQNYDILIEKPIIIRDHGFITVKCILINPLKKDIYIILSDITDIFSYLN